MFIWSHFIMDISKDQIESFWSKVDIGSNPKDCWNWTGAKKPAGYGNVRVNKKYLLSHRVAFEIVNGEFPSKFKVCHICDNPSCCNPNHLMLGTTKSNAADMLIKGREKNRMIASRGEVNGNSKLTAKKVKAIREAYKNREMNQGQLASKYGVTQAAIGYIVRNKTWRHVK